MSICLSNKQQLLETLNKIRKNKLCCYLQEKCDCKYGDLGKRCDHNEETTGCPEMRDCIDYIEQYLVEDTIGSCRICKEPVSNWNVAKKRSGDIRRDDNGNLWCQDCVDKFDELEPK